MTAATDAPIKQPERRSDILSACFDLHETRQLADAAWNANTGSDEDDAAAEAIADMLNVRSDRLLRRIASAKIESFHDFAAIAAVAVSFPRHSLEWNRLLPVLVSGLAAHAPESLLAVANPEVGSSRAS